MSAKRQRPPVHPDLRNALAMLGDIPADAVTAEQCWKAVAPPCPPGKRYARWSFWGVLHAPVLVRVARVWKVVNHIHAKKRHAEQAGMPWPPKAVFVPILDVPQPTERKI